MIRSALALTFCIVAATPSLAQSVTPPKADSAAPANDSGLSRSPVIRPGNPDPGIDVTPPRVGITPVVPPPGSTNGTSVVPK